MKVSFSQEELQLLANILADRLLSEGGVVVNKSEERWLTKSQVKNRLNIKSDTTLYSLRIEGKIRYSRINGKQFLYDRLSIEEYLDRNAQNPF